MPSCITQAREGVPMDKNTNPFILWCISATSLIRYGPDRHAVSDELLAHLHDHYDALIEQGMQDLID